MEKRTDYELMQWLDQHGYEPTKENLKVLREAEEQISKEDAEVLNSASPEELEAAHTELSQEGHPAVSDAEAGLETEHDVPSKVVAISPDGTTSIVTHNNEISLYPDGAVSLAIFESFTDEELQPMIGEDFPVEEFRETVEYMQSVVDNESIVTTENAIQYLTENNIELNEYNVFLVKECGGSFDNIILEGWEEVKALDDADKAYKAAKAASAANATVANMNRLDAATQALSAAKSAAPWHAKAALGIGNAFGTVASGIGKAAGTVAKGIGAAGKWAWNGIKSAGKWLAANPTVGWIGAGLAGAGAIAALIAKIRKFRKQRKEALKEDLEILLKNSGYLITESNINNLRKGMMIGMYESREYNSNIAATNIRDNMKASLVESELCELFNEFGVDYSILTEEAQTASIREVIISLLDKVENKLNSVDTTVADRSKGDIRSLKELHNIQECITHLETMIERADAAMPEAKEYIQRIIKSILYLNQHSAVFKEAYRNKKTVLVLKYESIILSIISSVSYLISVLVDFSAGGVALKKAPQLEEIAPLKSLKDFNDSVENKTFKAAVDDVTVIREFFLEIPVEDMSQILEAAEVLPMMINGVKELIGGLTNNPKVINIVYKAAGILLLILSLRDVFYQLFRAKTKVSEMTAQLGNFANLNNGGSVVNKLSAFANKFRTDMESSTDLAKREIEDENRQLGVSVKNIASNPVIELPAKKENEISSDLEFDF